MVSSRPMTSLNQPPLEDGDDDAERGGDRDRDREGGFDRHQDRAEHDHEQEQHPFDPTASPLCADIPMVVGTTMHEAAFGFPPDQEMSEDDLAQQMAVLAAEHGDAVMAAYRDAYPTLSAKDRFILAATDRSFASTRPSWPSGSWKVAPRACGRTSSRRRTRPGTRRTAWSWRTTSS